MSHHYYIVWVIALTLMRKIVFDCLQTSLTLKRTLSGRIDNKWITVMEGTFRYICWIYCRMALQAPFRYPWLSIRTKVGERGKTVSGSFSRIE